MAAWQKPARVVVALVGVVTAVVVYLNVGERRRPAPVGDAPQLPPRAVMQSAGGVLRQFLRGAQEYEVRWGRSTTYDDGSTRAEDVTIAATDREAREFVITAAEAHAAPGNREIELRGTVRVREGGGFELSAEHGFFDQETGIVRADGPVSFTTGRLTGRGRGMTYDDRTQVLRIVHDARLALAGTGEAEGVEVAASGGTLDRLQDLLMLDGPARIVRGAQVTTTLAAVARLTPDENRLTFLELRGESRVMGGGGALEAMRADAIDLEYADDGQTVERALLRGGAALVLDAAEGTAGRELRGDTVEITLRAGNLLERLSAAGGVSMTLPSAETTAPPSAPPVVQARTLEATAGNDGVLSEARFTDDVIFREALKDGTREARSRTLVVAMRDGAVQRARFGGSATFTDGGLQARAADADYHPGDGRLLLRGRDARGVPSAADEGIAIEAVDIDVALGSRGIVAKGGVKTALEATRSAPAGKPGATEAQGRLPGLLQQDQPVRIMAGALTYAGDAGTAVYTGRARLLQGDATEMRAETIEIHRERGDLLARGGATSTLLFDTERSTGSAESIRYVDATRTITYEADAADPAARAHLTGPQGDVRGRRIEVRLAADESRVERLVATGDVRATIETRTAHGATLTYDAAADRYVVTGTAAVPVHVEERVEDACRAMEGRTLTFTRAADTMVIDGEGESRTRTVRRTPCR